MARSPMIEEALEVILQDFCPASVVRDADAGVTATALWSTLEQGGFTNLLEPEALDGAGLDLFGIYPILRMLGRYAVPLPVGQTLFARALMPGRVPRGMVTIPASARFLEDGSVCCSSVPYGLIADWVMVADSSGALMLLSCSESTKTAIPSNGANALATLVWADRRSANVLGRAEAAGIVDVSLNNLGAALHAALLAGAMVKAIEMALDFCSVRVQFGKTIDKFHAIQHQLAVLVEHAAATSVAAELPFGRGGLVPDPFAVAVAKARTSEAAQLVAATTHAVHGAIGITDEYDLQLFTRRLHDWRMAHGSESHWNRVIGSRVLDGDDDLIDIVTST